MIPETEERPESIPSPYFPTQHLNKELAMRTKNIFLLGVCLLMPFFIFLAASCTKADADTEEFPLVKYVATKDGLNVRESPSASSNKVGTFLYGERVVLWERSTHQETIDGITSYWYRGDFYQSIGIPWDDSRRDNLWIFGGYLSSTMPEDVSPVLGKWDTDRRKNLAWRFSPDGTGSLFIKDGHGQGFDWVLVGDRLTATVYIDRQYEGNEIEIWEMIVAVINHDKIVLTFPDGSRPQEILDRSNDAF